MTRKTASSSLVYALTCVLILIGWPPGAATIFAEPIEIAAVNHPQAVDFQQEILPILRKNCLACHNAADGESDLVLETPTAILQGGSSGPAVVAGDGRQSLLLQVASHQAEPVMPPEDNGVGAENFTPQQLGLLRLWIDQGAKGQVRTEDSSIRWQPLPPNVNAVLALSLSADGDYLAAARANQVVMYRAVGPTELGRLTDPALAAAQRAVQGNAAHLDIVQSLAFSPDSQWLASGGYRTVKLWRRTADLLQDQHLKDVQVSVAAESRSGRFLVIGTENGTLRVWDLVSGRQESDATGNTQPVTVMAISPDEQLIACVRQDKTLHLVQREGMVALGQVQLSLVIRDLLFVNDHTLAAACDDHQIHTWTVVAHDQQMRLRESHPLTGHSQPVNALAPWQPDQLLSASDDGTVRVWNVKDAQELRVFDHGAPVLSLAASPHAGRAVSGSATGGTRLWDPSEGKLIAELNVDLQLQHRANRSRRQFEIAQHQVVNATHDLEEGMQRKTQEDENLKKAQQVHMAAAEDFGNKQSAAQQAQTDEKAAIRERDEIKMRLQQAEKDQTNASNEAAQQDAAARVEQLRSALQAAQTKANELSQANAKAREEQQDARQNLDSAQRSLHQAEAVVVDAEQALDTLAEAVVVAEKGRVAAEAAFRRDDKLHRDFQHHTQLTDFAPHGQILATAGETGCVYLWNAADGAALNQVECDAKTRRVLTFVANDRVLTLARTGIIRQWVTNPHWELAHVIGAPHDRSPFTDRVTALEFSPDGQWLAVGGGEPSRSGQVKIFEVDDQQMLLDFPEAHSDTVFGLAFSPNGRYLATCGADRFVKVFDLQTGEQVRYFEGHTHHVLDVAWQADGRILASAGADRAVKLWSFPAGDQLRTIQGFGKEVTSLQFIGATNRFLASCGDQILYRCHTDGMREPVGRGSDYLYCVSASQLGTRIAFGGHDGIVWMVDADGTIQAEIKP